MFTGIIEEVGKIKSIERKGTGYVIEIECSKIIEDMHIGDSISINGVCQSVTSFTKNVFFVFASCVTFSVTNFSHLKKGMSVNLERALLPFSRLGGHIVQGHVDGIGTIKNIVKDLSGVKIEIETTEDIMKHVVDKGSISCNGISLTIVEKKYTSFMLYLIPQSLEDTTLKNCVIGEKVNIETDIIGKYVENFVLKKDDKNIMSSLAENGFI